jgi:effector-binding domain-containing protein
MLDTPKIVQTTAQPAAVIRLTIPRVEIRQHMGPAMQEVMMTVATLGLVATGPMFSHHFRVTPDIFDFEVGVPVRGTVTPTGRVVASTLPACTVARTVYRGGFEGLGAAWGEFNAWVKANGHTGTDGMWESYLAGPESSPDPKLWATELNRPLVVAGQ